MISLPIRRPILCEMFTNRNELVTTTNSEHKKKMKKKMENKTRKKNFGVLIFFMLKRRRSRGERKTKEVQKKAWVDKIFDERQKKTNLI